MHVPTRVFLFRMIHELMHVAFHRPIAAGGVRVEPAARLDGEIRRLLHLSLSRLNHRLPGGEAHPEVVQGTAQFHHEITAALPPYADPVFDDATALDTAMDMVDPQPTLVELLVRHVRRRREFLPQIGINSTIQGLALPAEYQLVVEGKTAEKRTVLSLQIALLDSHSR